VANLLVAFFSFHEGSNQPGVRGSSRRSVIQYLGGLGLCSIHHDWKESLVTLSEYLFFNACFPRLGCFQACDKVRGQRSLCVCERSLTLLRNMPDSHVYQRFEKLRRVLCGSKPKHGISYGTFEGCCCQGREGSSQAGSCSGEDGEF
jgi:hypothetical protein